VTAQCQCAASDSLSAGSSLPGRGVQVGPAAALRLSKSAAFQEPHPSPTFISSSLLVPTSKHCDSDPVTSAELLESSLDMQLATPTVKPPSSHRRLQNHTLVGRSAVSVGRRDGESFGASDEAAAAVEV
jgi:hypothetical protein